MAYIEPYRAAIVTSVKAALGNAIKDCRSHPGRFDLKELQTVATKSPAVLVACLGIAKIGGALSDKREIDLVMAAFVATADAKQMSRDVAGLLITEALALHIADHQRWGLGYVKKPTNLKGTNLYSSAQGGKGVALWSLSWRQALIVPATGIAADDQDLLSIGLNYFLQDPVDDDVADAADNVALDQT